MCLSERSLSYWICIDCIIYIFIHITFRNLLKVRLEFCDRPVECKCERRPPVDEHVNHLLNCKLFTAEVKDRHDAIVHEVHSLSQHGAKLFRFPNMMKCELPQEKMGERLVVLLGD